MAIYDSKPSVYEANGDGSFTYRWNFREVQPAVSSETSEEQAQEQKTSWECNEVVVWATVTREKLTAAVLASLWSSDYEAKLINDYNAANSGVFGKKTEDEAKKYIDRYMEFLKERKSVKEQVSADCKEIQIV
jgi:hypothetical protein